MSELDLLNQNLTTFNKTQLSLIKQNFAMQEKQVEIVEDSRETSLLTKGQKVDYNL